ncbi:MAG: protein-L-isoaspartate(D-aspartate) O-methyltransferase [Phyllobacteriaceae bacterium]|nr:protein-L-isoaspartate(D-aspartate) O-methyltransferase [Phyllobacteriaceae bacterium]
MNVSVYSQESHAAFVMRMRAGGIADTSLLKAFETVRRQDFLAPEWRGAAWSSGMLPIGCGEAMESIDLQARIIGALDIKGGERVLEIGTGSGYTAAVMATLGARIVTIDRYRTLCAEASARFEKAALSIGVRHADGTKGLPGEGPFDRVIVWAAFDQLPRFLADQIASNGILVTPIGLPEEPQGIVKLTKVGSRFDREEIGHTRLQPLIAGLSAKL